MCSWCIFWDLTILQLSSPINLTHNQQLPKPTNKANQNHLNYEPKLQTDHITARNVDVNLELAWTIELGVQVQKMLFACSLENDTLYANISLAHISFISYLCSVRIINVVPYQSPNYLCESNTSASNFIFTSLLIKMLCNTEWRTDSNKIPIEYVPCLQVYWHPFVHQFLMQL